MAIAPRVAEVRQIRDASAKQWHYDVSAMWRDLNECQHQRGRKVVSLPPRHREPTALGVRRQASSTKGWEPTG
jgi:hypothetical protein